MTFLTKNTFFERGVRMFLRLSSLMLPSDKKERREKVEPLLQVMKANERESQKNLSFKTNFIALADESTIIEVRVEASKVSLSNLLFDLQEIIREGKWESSIIGEAHELRWLFD